MSSQKQFQELIDHYRFFSSLYEEAKIPKCPSSEVCEMVDKLLNTSHRKLKLVEKERKLGKEYKNIYNTLKRKQ